MDLSTVQQAVLALQVAGAPVSVRRLRAQIGYGSFRDLSRLLPQALKHIEAMRRPPVVKTAQDFLRECCEFAPDTGTRTRALQEALILWRDRAQASSVYWPSVEHALRRAGYRHDYWRGWIGVGLKPLPHR